MLPESSASEQIQTEGLITGGNQLLTFCKYEKELEKRRWKQQPPWIISDALDSPHFVFAVAERVVSFLIGMAVR